MDRQEINKLESPLLNKLITAYNDNSDNGTISIELGNNDLQYLILSVKNEVAREEILNYELYNRRDLKRECLENELL